MKHLKTFESFGEVTIGDVEYYILKNIEDNLVEKVKIREALFELKPGSQYSLLAELTPEQKQQIMDHFGWEKMTNAIWSKAYYVPIDYSKDPEKSSKGFVMSFKAGGSDVNHYRTILSEMCKRMEIWYYYDDIYNDEEEISTVFMIGMMKSEFNDLINKTVAE